MRASSCAFFAFVAAAAASGIPTAGPTESPGRCTCPPPSDIADVILDAPGGAPATPLHAASDPSTGIVYGAPWTWIPQDGVELQPFQAELRTLSCGHYYGWACRRVENGTVIKVDCKTGTCDVYVFLYHEPPRSSNTNGRLPQTLPPDWESGSCAPSFCIRTPAVPQPVPEGRKGKGLQVQPTASPTASPAAQPCCRMTAFRKQVSGSSEVQFTIDEVFGTMDAYYLVLAVAPGVDSGSNSGQTQSQAASMVRRGNRSVAPLPCETIADAELSDSFAWCNRRCGNYFDQHRSQHIQSEPHNLSSILVPCKGGVCVGLTDPDRAGAKLSTVDAIAEHIYVHICVGFWALVALAVPRGLVQLRRTYRYIRLWLRPPPPAHPDWLLPVPLGFIDTRSPRRRARPATPPTPRTPQQGCSPAPSTYSSSSSSTCSPRSPHTVRRLRRQLSAQQRTIQEKEIALSNADSRMSSVTRESLVTSTMLWITTTFLDKNIANQQQERLQHRATKASLDAANARIQRLTQEVAEMRAGAGHGQGGAGPAAAPPSGGNW
eukprot:TRINITY_DN1751_c0_g1_i9.p1 TRINITY_DN1751_c0_g1~~TRINITY_DN1751_c0_g1_i9.p1  ORF type:complete len:574 (+),score=129.48 TRINITY_DN1751_c0_g1_i9:84-1724(+)